MPETSFDIKKCRLSGKWLNIGDSAYRRDQDGGTNYKIKNHNHIDSN